MNGAEVGVLTDSDRAASDWIQATVERVHNPPTGWAWCRSEVIGEAGHFLVTGGVPRTLKRGPRKGCRTWKDSELTQYVITKAQIDEGKTLWPTTI